MIEKGGFWNNSRRSWVNLERVQFVGACNPPTDPGRYPISQRLLRFIPVVYVDYPSKLSLFQIYGSYMRGITKMLPSLRGYADDITNAMIEVYVKVKSKFTVDQQMHYVYSPRELTR
jgi:dynein heavy chain 1